MRRTDRYLFFWIGLLIGIPLAGFADLMAPRWSSVPFAGIAVAHWAWWTRRATRGLERTRYEPAPEG